MSGCKAAPCPQSGPPGRNCSRSGGLCCVAKACSTGGPGGSRCSSALWTGPLASSRLRTPLLPCSAYGGGSPPVWLAGYCAQPPKLCKRMPAAAS